MCMWVQRTYKCMFRKCTLCAHNTDGDKFSAADQGTRAAQYDEMDMADQPQQKLNNTLYVTLSNLPVCIPFSLTPPNHLLLPWLHHYHPFSFLRSSSQLSAPAAFSSSFLFFIAHIFPPSPSGSWLKTHTQTDSGTERQPGSDLHTEL